MAINSPSLRMWGHFEHSLDEKGRVIVPAKFRDKLGDEFVLTTGSGNHIRVYPMPIWESIEEQLASGDALDDQNENLVFLQRLYGNCEFVSPDQQNRLSIPRHLRDWAHLQEGDTAVIVGVGTRLEIWSRADWAEISKGFTEPNAAQAASNRKLSERAASPAANGGRLAVLDTREENAPHTP